MSASAIWFAGACVWLHAASAFATYSIVATDTRSMQVGGAGTSCLNGGDVYGVYGSAPGKGAVHSQARSSRVGRDRAVELLQADMAPADIIVAITEVDDLENRRQYGVVDLEGRAAGHTGADNGSFANDVQGSVGTFTYSAQGNILTGPAVLEQASLAFEAGGCDLAERLLLALEAGAANGEGDSRCTPDGIPSDSAYVQVDAPGEPWGSYLVLRVRSSGDQSPLPELRLLYEEWRLLHPCPEPMPVDAGATDAGSAGDRARAGAAAGGVGSLGGQGPAGAGGRVGEAMTVAGAPAAGATASPQADLPPTAASPETDAGCACHIGSVPLASGSLALLLLVAMTLLGRRSAPARRLRL